MGPLQGPHAGHVVFKIFRSYLDKQKAGLGGVRDCDHDVKRGLRAVTVTRVLRSFMLVVQSRAFPRAKVSIDRQYAVIVRAMQYFTGLVCDLGRGGLLTLACRRNSIGT